MNMYSDSILGKFLQMIQKIFIKFFPSPIHIKYVLSKEAVNVLYMQYKVAIHQTCSRACRCSFLILSSLRRTGSSWRSTRTPRWRRRERLCSVTSRQSVTRSSDRPRQYSPTALTPERRSDSAWSTPTSQDILPRSVTRQQPVMSKVRRLGQNLAIPFIQSSVML